MNNTLWQISDMLGRARFEDALREAEAARLAARLPVAPPQATWRRRLGRILIAIGTALEGPRAGQPANDH